MRTAQGAHRTSNVTTGYGGGRLSGRGGHNTCRAGTIRIMYSPATVVTRAPMRTIAAIA